MTGIILAGGRSRRFGRDKAALPWGDGDLLGEIAARLATVCDEVLVAMGDRQLALPAGVRGVVDAYADSGPLAGIHAGLRAARYPVAFVTACDMPFVEPAAVPFLKDLMAGYDAAVPRVAGRWAPLFACYATSCLPAMEKLLGSGVRRVFDLYGHIRCRAVPGDAFRQFDPELRMFQDLNTPGDYARARRERPERPGVGKS
jgi:molybdopterin-guanine dinucleotide biosynthesis protein A